MTKPDQPTVREDRDVERCVVSVAVFRTQKSTGRYTRRSPLALRMSLTNQPAKGSGDIWHTSLLHAVLRLHVAASAWVFIRNNVLITTSLRFMRIR